LGSRSVLVISGWDHAELAQDLAFSGRSLPRKSDRRKSDGPTEIPHDAVAVDFNELSTGINRTGVKENER